MTVVSPVSVAPEPVELASRSAKLTNIQVLRFVAASFVVLYHSWYYLGVFVGKPPILDVVNGQWGFYGVAIFFAISGFLMSDLLQKTDCWTFILHRAVRIYPLYYLVFLAFFPWQAGYDAIGLLLVPAGEHPGPLGIEWTLVYETAFYVLLFVVSFLGLARHVAVAASLWLAAILLTTWFAPEWQNTVALPIQTLPFVLYECWLCGRLAHAGPDETCGFVAVFRNLGYPADTVELTC